jgi:tRNA nucleotidyltransferase (CCA-adding enzyme)
MQPHELIATHTNTDFDAFAAMVAAHKLYPEAVMCLSNAVNRNVREFHGLYADEIETVEPAAIDLTAVHRLILVDTVHPNRLGELAPLCRRKDVDVIVFDHHGHAGDWPDFVRPENIITSEDGSLVTLLLRVVAERGIPLTSLEATTCALGIHEDTGSLTFSTTTTRDAEALAYCMRSGAEPAIVERFLHTPLTLGQRHVLATALANATPIDVPELDVLVAEVRQQAYVEGVSVVAHRVMDLTHADAFFLLVQMEGRIFVAARSRGGALDVGAVLRSVGGGGHAAAASAVFKDAVSAASLDAARSRLQRAVRAGLPVMVSARDLMSPATEAVVAANASVDAEVVICRKLHLGGVAVSEHGVVIGVTGRPDLEAAVRHRLGGAPVKAVMSGRVVTVAETASTAAMQRLLATAPTGWLAVVKDPDVQSPPVDDVLGLVTRRAVARRQPREPAEQPSPPAANVAGLLADLGLDDLFAHVQAIAGGYRGVYLVGGAVRDLLLHERTIDIDLAVEGDGIEFARELALRLNGRVRPHEKFQTAVIVTPGGTTGQRLRIDVASTRSEFYDYPAALPKVEHASIRSDLARRDFTINAMAIALKPEEFGVLYDPFAGMDDLAARRIVVLHALSFIEDPTRIFRALRYESRYGLRMDSHTWNLARTCVDLNLVGDLSSARLRDELVVLLGESTVMPALRRFEELDLARVVHPRCVLGETGRVLLSESDEVWRHLRLVGEVPLWRLRLVWLLRDLEPEELTVWAAGMRLRRRDAAVLARAMVVGRRRADLIKRGPSEAELYDAAEGEPAEALIVAAVLDDSGIVADRIASYLGRTRATHLAINGDDLLALGYVPSAGLGTVLRSLLHLKLNGVIAGREQELEAARRMLYP